MKNNNLSGVVAYSAEIDFFKKDFSERQRRENLEIGEKIADEAFAKYEVQIKNAFAALVASKKQSALKKDGKKKNG
jgi:hypothetical protein